MVLVNIDHIPGVELEALGLVTGTTVRAVHFGRDFLAGLQNIVGGEIDDYTEMLAESRRIATERMVREAEKLGADAVVNVRFGTSAVMQSAAEVIAYGTAVRVREREA